jgi:hypothetical protein
LPLRFFGVHNADKLERSVKFAYCRQRSELGLAWLEYSKIDGQCKLVIEPGDVPGFVVFADFTLDAETVTNSKIRKGSSVSVRGKFETFGAKAVCLSDCRLQRFATLKKENGKPNKT